MNIKEALISILNVLTQVETKGQNTLMMADCITALDKVISQIPGEVHESAPEVEAEEE